MSITHKQLKNGMNVMLVPQNGVASMTVMAFARVGSRYETKEINGASHFVEHLMFKGTKRRPNTLALTKELDRYGAEFNAFTSKDLTAYYIKMDAQHTALAVDLLHDMLFHSLYDPAEIDRERGVIIEEINMYEDNPRTQMEDLLEEVLYPESTLGWNIAGPREVIKKITREQLTSYRDRYYVPSRMTVVVAGKIVPGVWKMLEQTFGTVKAPNKLEDTAFAPFIAPKKLVEAVDFRQKKTEQVQLGMAFHGIPYTDKQIPALSLLSTILGGTMSSRLFIEVRERRGLCYSISAGHQPFEDTGMFVVAAGLPPNRLKEAIKVIKQELRKITKDLVTAEELRRAKDHIRGKLTLAFEDPAAQADWFGKQWVFQKKTLSPEERLRAIERVKPAEIREIAKKIFRPAAMSAALVGPFEKKKDIEDLFVNG
ncbi:MAG: pitrilysin family protein [Patescibacteria group bacterium]